MEMKKLKKIRQDMELKKKSIFFPVLRLFGIETILSLNSNISQIKKFYLESREFSYCYRKTVLLPSIRKIVYIFRRIFLMFMAFKLLILRVHIRFSINHHYRSHLLSGKCRKNFDSHFLNKILYIFLKIQ
jgi:hypothetical protein